MQLSTVVLAGLFALGATAAPGYNSNPHHYKDLDYALSKHKYTAFCEKLIGHQYKKTSTVKTEVVVPTTKVTFKKVTETVKFGVAYKTKKAVIVKKAYTTVYTTTKTIRWGKTVTTLPCKPPPSLPLLKTGDAPAADAAAGDAPSEDAPAADVPAGDAPAGDDTPEEDTTVERRGLEFPSPLRKWKHDDVRAACYRFLKPSGTTTVTKTRTKYYPTHTKVVPIFTKKVVPKYTKTITKKFTITNTKTIKTASTTKVATFTYTHTPRAPICPSLQT